MKRRKGKATSKHHIIPRSRGGKNTDKNIALLVPKDHERYHALFINKTPEEILHWLVTYFWGGDISHVRRFIKEYPHAKT